MAEEIKIYKGNIMSMGYVIDDLNHKPYVSVTVYAHENDTKDIYFEVRYYFTNKHRDKSYSDLYNLIYKITNDKHIGSLSSWFGKLDGSNVLVIETNKKGNKSYSIKADNNIQTINKERK